MNVVVVYARIYGACAGRALLGLKKSPWTLLLPMALWAVTARLAMVLAPLGLVGGLLLALAFDAAFSSYLYVTSEIVADAKVRIEELKRSIGPYFWAVLNLMFVIWLIELVIGMALSQNPHGAVIAFLLRLAGFVLLNATPEIIYQRKTYGGLATIQATIGFIHANWIEWFIPNLLLGAAFYYGIGWLLAVGVHEAIVAVVGGALLHAAMVFRGHLFRELDKSSHRQRMYRYKAAS